MIKMYRRPTKKKEFLVRLLVYTGMTILVLTIVTGLLFMMLGYRFDRGNGHLEQGALVQFASTPSGATIKIDGNTISARTPAKNSVVAGQHQFEMSRQGYDTWSKSVNVAAGTLTWLNYALLVPQKLIVQPTVAYETLYATSASPTGREVLVQQSISDPTFQLVDVSSDTVKSTAISVPNTLYSEATTVGVTHSFKMESWDLGGRYVLLQHMYGEKMEWIVFDTQNPAASSNITTLFDLGISTVYFSGTSGNTLYVLSGSDIRKVDISAGTISRALVSNVVSFSLFSTNIITYVGTGQAGTPQRVVGIYQDGDVAPHILRTTTSAADVPLMISTTRYFNDDYIAIAEGAKVDIMNGSYPSSPTDKTSLKSFASYTLPTNVGRLEFSPLGEYILTQSGAAFAEYDLEYRTLAQSVIEGDGAVALLRWLNDYYLWSDHGGNMTIREMDGANVHTINPVVPGQDAVLTQNGRYIYSIGKTATGYQLQRVLMVLP